MSNNINRIALLYRDLLSSKVHHLSNDDMNEVLSLKPNKNKVIAIGNIDYDNWNAYPLAYLLTNKLVAPVVLSDSQIYQSWHAMRVHDEKIIHPQNLISQSVVIRFMGLDCSANINDYINSFISMCSASDECKIIFVIFECNKKYYRDNIYIRHSNSTFIDTSSGKPYTVDSTPLCISPDEIVFFHSETEQKKSDKAVARTKTTHKCGSLSSLLSHDNEF